MKNKEEIKKKRHWVNIFSYGFWLIILVLMFLSFEGWEDIKLWVIAILISILGLEIASSRSFYRK